VLGWKPEIPIEEGLRRTRDYFYRALGVERASA
jgi:nucleoside-diphosphate-sugar epimerase